MKFCPGGEFQDGGSDIKIQEISSGGQAKQSGGNAYSYPSGIGPLIINGCFGNNYKKGDPCYAAKRLNTKCLNMIEAANYIGQTSTMVRNRCIAGQMMNYRQNHFFPSKIKLQNYGRCKSM